MPALFDISSRRFALIILGGAAKPEIADNTGAQPYAAKDLSELRAALSLAHSKNERMLVIVLDKDFDSALQEIRSQAEEDVLARIGILCVSDKADDILVEKNRCPELLNTVSRKTLEAESEAVLLRLVRDLIRKEERESRRIGQKMLERLNQIFVTLSAERNPQRLLATILAEAMELTEAESGVLHVIEERDGEYHLKVKIASEGNDEMVLQHLNQHVKENSFIGWSVFTGKLLNQNFRGNAPRLNPLDQKIASFEDEPAVKSVLVVPFKNSRNEIIAVIKLVDKRLAQGLDASEEENCSFDHEDESLMTSFATQAAICLENLELYGDLRGVFDGFVKAAITAIESRDPSTGGHSERVAKMTVALAEATNHCEAGIYRSVNFKPEEIRELNYAALLHDFGKIGVREEVLVKAKKLYPFQLEAIRDRLKLWRTALYIDFMQKTQTKNISESTAKAEYEAELRKLDEYWKIIQQSNEPSVLKQESITQLEQISHDRLKLPDGFELALLTEEEYNALSIRKGSLTDVERLEVESHVRHTYQFLKMIPWSRGFKRLPEIAYAHHEKLDGSGYPRNLTSHEIPLQSKIMTIADIFDALTAADRWYKDAVPPEKALDILQLEVKAGKMDPVLFEIFIQAKIYDVVNPRSIKKFA